VTAALGRPHRSVGLPQKQVNRRPDHAADGKVRARGEHLEATFATRIERRCSARLEAPSARGRWQPPRRQNRTRWPTEPSSVIQKLMPSLHTPDGSLLVPVGTLAMKLRSAALNSVTLRCTVVASRRWPRPRSIFPRAEPSARLVANTRYCCSPPRYSKFEQVVCLRERYPEVDPVAACAVGK
jgi:hypothetical protein